MSQMPEQRRSAQEFAAEAFRLVRENDAHREDFKLWESEINER